MNFEDSTDEAKFRKESREWLLKNSRLLASNESANGILEIEGTEEELAESREWQQRKYRDGYACVTWPSEYGGKGLSNIYDVIWEQEEGRFSVPANPFIIGINMAGPVIIKYGTDEQKERFIGPMAKGEEIWCQLFSEPSGGSDLAGVRTTARRDGDDWVVNGQKVWTTGAHYSQWGILLARTDPSVPKHQGMTYFLLDMSAPGVEVRPIRQMSGQSGFSEVFFTDVRVPDSCRLGAVGEGWSVALSTLMHERSGFSGGLSPSIQKELRAAIATAPLELRQQMTRIYAELKGLEYFGYRCMTKLSRGEEPGSESSLIKLVSAPLQQRLAALMLDVIDAGDESATAAAEQWTDVYLSSPGLRIAGGTDEIMRNIIAERILGLPTEIRQDKGIPFRDVANGSTAAAKGQE